MSLKNQNGRTTPAWLRKRGVLVIGAVIFGLAAFLLGFALSPDSSSQPGDDAHRHSAGTQTEPTTWTCSMHPQIQLPKPGQCPICFMDLIPVEENAADRGDAPILSLSETAKQIARIQTAPVRRAFQSARIDLTGKLAVAETRLTRITARYPGRIDKLYADYTGMRISDGESLADIYSPELISAQQELIQAAKFKRQLPETATPLMKKTAATILRAAREKLRQWGLMETQISVIEESDDYYEHMTVSSPVQGTVIEKRVVEGAYVSTGDPLYVIADLSKLWIILQAYESDIVWLTEGQPVSFTVKAFPGREFTGTISFIDPIVESGSRTVRVRAVVDNSNNLLKPDMFVRASVEATIDNQGNIISSDGRETADLTDAPLLIPASAPLITGKRAVVYVATDNDDGSTTFEGREVILGPRSGDFYIVTEGLDEGDAVVVNGAFKIDSELQIQAKPSMMSPDDPGDTDMSGDSKSAKRDNNDSSANRITESAQTVRALTPLYDAYFELQMALANDNVDEAVAAAGKLSEGIDKIDMSIFSMDGHERWMELSQKLIKQARRGARAGDIESVRDAFYYLSDAIIALHDTFGHAPDEKYYLAFCPMARDNSGAHWLQQVDIIWNSFYGDRMLRCGEIQDSTESILREGN